MPACFLPFAGVEVDNTARYHNHQDEASSIKWLSIHDSSVLAAKLKQVSKEEPNKEIKCILNEKLHFLLIHKLFSFRCTRVCVNKKRRNQLRQQTDYTEGF